MTDLTRLRVSRTKHGAYKISLLLKKCRASEALDRVTDNDLDIHIDKAQAKKHLCVGSEGVVPDIWTEAKRLGSEAIDGLVLVALIFSHHKLISAMQSGRVGRTYIGVIRSERKPPDKTYSAFARDLEMLGFSVEHSIGGHYVKYDLHRLFEIPGLNRLVGKVLEHKLREAGWRGHNALVDEAVKQRFHDVFAVTEQRFAEWLQGFPSTDVVLQDGQLGDATFFFAATDRQSPGFVFKPGQNKKRTGKIAVRLPSGAIGASLLHNAIQNKLSDDLIAEYGGKNVRTEHPTNDGTSIDIVVRVEEKFRFYEIKTDSSVRGCIRQGLPQLMEYAYWCGDPGVDSLIVVGPAALTKQGDAYLRLLRQTFGLPVFYQQFDIESLR